MRTAVRAFAVGAAAVCAATLIIACYVASIDEPSLEAVAFLPLMLLLAAIASALYVGTAREFAAFCAGSIAAAIVIVLAWARLHVDGVDLVVWFVAMPTFMGALVGSASRALFMRGKRSWEVFRDESRAASM